MSGGGKIEDVLEYLRNILSKFNTEDVLYDVQVPEADLNNPSKYSNVTLNKNALNYDELEIRWVNNNGAKGIQKIIVNQYTNNGGYCRGFSISILVPATGSTQLSCWMQAGFFTVAEDGLSIKTSYGYQSLIGSSTTSIDKTCRIIIEKVIGIKKS